ncbi:LOW QUALITY PROTEIN: gephyrin-like [Pollicipes pollicipes]|uniref:LOW QUALITY PROTEIN: gephyrin-like n=1 Tax=Pollicipes pollicipes TaxID=41117 RepID=UPI0018859AB3|nr:LOW QUALITY PROTEIN: gephyrin-like [Pollicipes pollicipes]
MDPLKIGIIIVSDRAAAGSSADLTGPRLSALLEGGELFVAKLVQRMVVADERADIQAAVTGLSDRCDVLLTSGGTGFAARDVTPEAVAPLLERSAPGLLAAMLHGSLAVTPLAMLSRPVAGVRGRCVVVTLPGSPKAAEECVRLLAPGLPHAVDLLRDRRTRVEHVHLQLQSDTVPQWTHLRCRAGTAARRTPTIPLARAQEVVMDAVAGYERSVETLNISAAQDRVLAEDIVAKVPLPPFPASVKDGYAVCSADGVGVRHVLGASNAGVDGDGAASTVRPGTCVRISTGAAVPAGADAVVMVEQTRLAEASEDGTRELTVEILEAPRAGQDIRPVGSDIAKGTLVLDSGRRLGPFELASLAAVGVCQVTVFSRPTVAVMSTGNEVQEPGRPLEPGRIYDTNRLSLLAALPATGACVIDAGIAIDEPEQQLAALRSALNRADVLVTTGGVSMGERDLVKRLLTDDLGAQVHFGRVFMKPGMPTTFATLTLDGRCKYVFGLPGNPVSAAVCSVLHVMPALRAMAGLRDFQYSKLRVQLESEVRLDPRPEFARATLTHSQTGRLPVARVTGSQMSSNVLSLCRAVALLELPARTDQRASLPAGAEVDAIVVFGQL